VFTAENAEFAELFYYLFLCALSGLGVRNGYHAATPEGETTHPA